MYILRRSLASLLAASTLLLPVAASACGGMVHGFTNDFQPDYGNGGIISTPLSMKGRFIFVERVSRRTLLQMVAEHQEFYRPATIARAQI